MQLLLHKAVLADTLGKWRSQNDVARQTLVEALTSSDMPVKSCTSDVCLGFVSSQGHIKRHQEQTE